MGQAVLKLSSAEAPPADPCRDYADLLARVEAARAPAFWPATRGRRPLILAERAGLLRLAAAIPGAAGEARLAAMIEAMRHAPEGDVVEIGCAFGRTAALLAMLARRWQIGQVLCVDEWEPGARAAFEVSLAPIAGERLNWLEDSSEDAAERYAPGLSVRSEAFGATAYAGVISVLHLDGPRSFAKYASDIAMWAPHVAPGGWIIFGDHAGTFGAADAFAAGEGERIAAKFTAGGALFLQLKAR